MRTATVSEPLSKEPGSALTAAQIAALRSLPWRLTGEGNLSYTSPHGLTVQALRDRGLVQLNRADAQWELTPLGVIELARITLHEAKA